MKAAIEWIKWALKLGVEKGEIGVSDMEAESFQKILPVLEAAEKVDKKRTIELIETASRKFGSGRFTDILNLIYSLPEKE